jgi:mannose-6-phosphate isomerase-like protein (cupin superfamily)
MIEHIEHDGQTLAIVLKADFSSDSITFVTPDTFSLQLAYMSRPKDYVIQPHIHLPVARSTTMTQEVLFIRKGSLRVDFYDESKTYLQSRVLGPGDVILLATAGHGFEVLEPVDIIEVKQGPYNKDGDKERFGAVSKDQLRIGTSR